MARHPSLRRSAITACVASAMLAAAARAPAGQPEVFHGPGGMAGLLHPRPDVRALGVGDAPIGKAWFLKVL